MELDYSITLRKEITPKRLFSFLNLINLDYYSKKELKDLIYPSNLTDDKDNNFNRIFNFAEKMDIIYINKQGIVIFKGNQILNDDDNQLCEDTFKEYMNKLLFKNKKSKLFWITSIILKNGIETLNNNKISDISRIVSRESKVKDTNNELVCNNEDILAWKLWAKYLGYGYNLFDEFIILNPYKQIQETNKHIIQLVKNRSDILLKEYLDKLKELVPVVADSIDKNRLSFLLSMALITLHENKDIELIYKNDSTDIWSLQNMELFLLKRISHIAIGGKDV